MDHEEDIPTKQPAPEQKARFSNPYADQEWSQSSQDPAQEGAKTADSVGEFALPRSARLGQRTEYQRVYREGFRVVTRHFVFFCMTNAIGSNRLGITATRKIGSAVIRARCKRRTRELFRMNRQLLGNLGVDIVVNVKRSCSDAAWDDVRGDFLRGLKKILLIEQRRAAGNG